MEVHANGLVLVTRSGSCSACFRIQSVADVISFEPNWRTERHRKTKIGTEVARVTRDSDTTFSFSHWQIATMDYEATA